MMKSLAFVLLPFLYIASAYAQVTPSTVISEVNLVDVATGQIHPNMAVIIEGDRIVRLDRSSNVRSLRGAQALNGKGLFLIPGLWDMHVHLSNVRASALPALVANGVTTVRDLGSNLSEIDAWRGQISAGTMSGPRILRAGPILNGREFNRYQLAVANETEARTAVRTLSKVGVDFIKLHRAISRDAYFAIAAEAKQLGIPFVGHVPTTVSPAEASDAGQATVEHVETLFEGTFLTAERRINPAKAIAQWRSDEASTLFGKFAVNGTSFTPTLIAARAALQALESPQNDLRDKYVASSTKKETEEVIIQPLRSAAAQFLAQRKPMVQEFPAVVQTMSQVGVTLLAGTDLGASFIYPGFSLHDELTLLVEAGLSPLQALQAATLNPGKLFPNSQAGTITAGKKADMILLEANPLDDIRNTQRIRAVILNGRILNRQRLDALLREAERLARDN
jgi:imidazolonepropionase-like amidohydrolase